MEEDKILWALVYVGGFGFVATILRVLFKRTFDTIDKKAESQGVEIKDLARCVQSVKQELQGMATKSHVDSEVRQLQVELAKIAAKCHEVLREELTILRRETQAAHDKQTDRMDKIIELISKGK